MSEPDLHAVLKTGNLEAIRASLDGGADIRYVRPSGYTPLIDAMYIPSIETEVEHLPILRLLIERGADLDAENDIGESALGVAFRLDWFKAVILLLQAGADPDPIGWTRLHTAVSLGTVADVQSLIDAGDELEARDCWDRTPWLAAVQAGDIAKAEFLRAAGADITAREQREQTALMHAVGKGNHRMLRWLLDQGFDPNETDDFSGSPLLDAASNGDAESVRLLLEAGADLHHHDNANSTAIGAASNLDTVRLLVTAGADLSDINGDMRAALTGVPNDSSIDCTADEYQAAKHRVFGTVNPERMNFPFWQAMVRGGAGAYFACKKFDQPGPDDEAVWCFHRFGKSLTELPDGRVVEIAGEHEDFYDPDFCIYNDVFVHSGDGTFDIYGYPTEVFPPTDFHTATLVGRWIYVIGNLGYRGTRQFGTTPVYRLSTDTWAIERVETAGESPGWISRHKAKLVGESIEVNGGKVCRFADGKEHYEDNPDRFALDLATLRWSRVTEG